MNKILLSIILLSSMNLFSSENDNANSKETLDLHTACLEANINAVEKCLARGDSPTAYDHEGNTPAYYLLKDIVTCTTERGWFSCNTTCAINKNPDNVASILKQLQDKAKIDLLNSKCRHDSERTVRGEIFSLKPWYSFGSNTERAVAYKALFNALRKHGIDLLPDQANQA